MESKMSREVHGDAGQLDEKPEDPKEVAKVNLESGQYEGQNGMQNASTEVSDVDSDEIPEAECYKGELSPSVYMAAHVKVAQEIKKKFPLVGEVESLKDLESEYYKGRGYGVRLTDLKQKYRRMRNVRAEGNSLYRAFAFAAFELMIQHRSINDKLYQAIVQSKDKLLQCGMEEFAVEELHEKVVFVAEKINAGITENDLMIIMNDQLISDSIVAFMRLVTSANMIIEEDYYSYVLKKGEIMVDHCRKQIEPLGAPELDINICSLSNATGLGIRVEDLEPSRVIKPVPIDVAGDGPNCDNTGARPKTSASARRNQVIIEYVPPTGKDFPFAGVVPRVHLMRRPGHFDILYR